MRRLIVLAITLAALAVPASASAYLHVGDCLAGLAGANGDNEIEQTRPFDVIGNWYVDVFDGTRAGDHRVAWSWHWTAFGQPGSFWFTGECVGDDNNYVDRLIGPG